MPASYHLETWPERFALVGIMALLIGGSAITRTADFRERHREPVVEAVDVQPARAMGAYYPADDAQSPGLLESVDPVALAAVGGLTAFAAAGGVAWLLGAFGPRSRDELSVDSDVR